MSSEAHHFLTEDGKLRKSPKAELGQELKHNLDLIPDRLPISEAASIIVFEFMAYSRKVPVKKVKLQIFEELLRHLWTTFE